MHNTAGIAKPQVLTVLRRQQWQSAANPTHTPTDWRPAPRRWTGVFAARWTAPPRLHSGVGQERGQEMWASGTRRPTERRSGIAVARLMGGGSNKPAQKTRRPAYAACCIQTSPGSPTMLCCSAVRSTIRKVSSTRPSICRINHKPGKQGRSVRKLFGTPASSGATASVPCSWPHQSLAAEGAAGTCARVMSSVSRRRAENTSASRTVVPAECTSFCSTSAWGEHREQGARGLEAWQTHGLAVRDMAITHLQPKFPCPICGLPLEP